MSAFAGRNGVLHAESVPLPDIAARFGTPCWVYSRRALETALDEFQQELRGIDSLVCYAVKANSNIAVLDVLARRGAGFDIVSAGELKRVLAAGADPRQIVFSGVGKTAAEMELALTIGILCFNVESAGELERLNAVAGKLGKDGADQPAGQSGRRCPDAPLCLDRSQGKQVRRRLRRRAGALPAGSAPGATSKSAASTATSDRSCSILHLSSEALDKVLVLVDQLAADGIVLHHIDLGGGLGIRYRDEEAPTVKAYLLPMLARLKQRHLRILLEPGRRLVGNAGVLLTRVEYLKPGEVKNFAIVDAAMNDLARPALYGSWHDIVPVVPRQGAALPWEIVGPVCESGDFLGRGRELVLAAGDLLADHVGRRLQHGHEFELQQPPARCRGDGRRHADPSRPPPRDGRRALRAGAALAA
jgi:diaminopimelate decarboxylase